jgi:uncharacterized membrane-anchored protein
LLIVLVSLQIKAIRFHPWLYWATIVSSTTFGTTMADFADRSLGIGYTGGSTLLLVLLLSTLAICYWMAITFSQTLGTALGDQAADTGGLGYGFGALIFACALSLIIALYCWSSVSRVLLFWAAFIVTRPLGATVGDLLDKPPADGGLGFSRPLASLVIGVFIIACLLVVPQRPAGRRATAANGGQRGDSKA